MTCNEPVLMKNPKSKIYTPKRDDEHPCLFQHLLQVSVPAFQSQSLKIVCTVGSC